MGPDDLLTPSRESGSGKETIMSDLTTNTILIPRRRGPSSSERLAEWFRIRRDTARLPELDDHARRDMGLPIDPDRAFMRQLSANRWTPRDPSGW